ncbi:hypothetical protein HaLaN_05020 [Haematococcus lacustris]|uniref:Uncharacterized protein n=1 Tax=Haematococcus lacustris TaxID=44745 RepID=A0A699YHZ1_HAELA|nr:hypothetical protein HaLaN_05020 [Haematococcus lacustris]
MLLKAVSSCLPTWSTMLVSEGWRGIVARRARRSGCAASTAATAAFGRVFAPFLGRPRHSCRNRFLQLRSGMVAWETGMSVYTGWSCRPSGSAT